VFKASFVLLRASFVWVHNIIGKVFRAFFTGHSKFLLWGIQSIFCGEFRAIFAEYSELKEKIWIQLTENTHVELILSKKENKRTHIIQFAINGFVRARTEGDNGARGIKDLLFIIIFMSEAHCIQ
jgi:hypothetical protein